MENWKTPTILHVFVKWKMCSAATVCFSPPHYILFPCFHYSKLWILSLEQSRETATWKAQDVVAAALRLDGHALQHASEATRDDVHVYGSTWFHASRSQTIILWFFHTCVACERHIHIYKRIEIERLICLSFVCHMQREWPRRPRSQKVWKFTVSPLVLRVSTCLDRTYGVIDRWCFKRYGKMDWPWVMQPRQPGDPWGELQGPVVYRYIQKKVNY